MDNKIFSELFMPDQDPNFPFYEKHFFTLLSILEPFIKNKITEEEDVLKEIRSVLGCFAMYVFREAEAKANTILN